MSEFNRQEALEQAKAKLQEVNETKESRKDPRAGEGILPGPRKPPEPGDKDIKPVQGKPKKKKFSQKLKEAMFGEEVGKGGVTDFVFFKIFIPNAKRILSDMANTAINMALGLDPKTRTISASNTHTANASVYRDRNYSRPYSGDNRRREAISELEWDEATIREIYGQISDIIDRYYECSISDVYSIMGMNTRILSTDRNWGWTSMRGIEIVPVDRLGDRWILDMPPAEDLRYRRN